MIRSFVLRVVVLLLPDAANKKGEKEKHRFYGFTQKTASEGEEAVS